MTGDPKTLSDLVAAPAGVKQVIKPLPEGSPKYRVLVRSYLNGRIVEAGETIPYAGRPGQFLEHVSGPKWKEPKAAKSDPPADPAVTAAAPTETDSSGQPGTF